MPPIKIINYKYLIYAFTLLANSMNYFDINVNLVNLETQIKKSQEMSQIGT